MALIIQDVLDVNKYIPQAILDTSWIHGSVKYAANSEAELPTNPGFVKDGNLGVVNYGDGRSRLFQASIVDNIVSWNELEVSGTGGGGEKEIYWHNPFTEGDAYEQSGLPDDFLYVNPDIELDFTPNGIMLSLIKAVNRLENEVIRLKNTMNDLGGGDISDAESNHTEWIAKNPSDPHPLIAVDWTDSSYVDKIEFDPESHSYIDPSSGEVIYNNQILDVSTYPYETLPDDGINPNDDEFDQDASVLLLKHFHFKFAKTYAEMVAKKEYLVPYEPVICVENSTLYYYNPDLNKMVALGGTGGYIDPTDPSVNPDDPTETDEQIMADILRAFTDGSVNEIVLTDINTDPSTGQARKYSVSLAGGEMKIMEVKGTKYATSGSSLVVTTLPSMGTTTFGALVINEIYANDRAASVSDPDHDTTLPVSHNFIELANCDPEVAIDLSNVNLQYVDLTGTEPVWHKLDLKGHIEPGSTFLIRGAQVAPTNAPSTRINVSTCDMEWYENGKLLAMNNTQGALYLSFDASVYPESAVANATTNAASGIYATYTLTPTAGINTGTTPYTVPATYLDFIGWGTNNTYSESKPLANVGDNRIYVKAFMMDRSQQANAASLDKKNNSKFMDFVDVTKHYLGNEESFRPRASYEHKDIYTTRTSFRENHPYCVTVSFGIDPTTTRCFNWISPGIADEFVFWRKKGTTEWNIKESYKAGDGQDSELRTVPGTTVHIPAYDRIYWETSGHDFVTTHKCIVKGLEASLKYYTDKDLKTTSSSATKFTKGTEYEYCVGQGIYDKYGTCIGPDVEHCSDIYGFQVRSAVTDKQWYFVQHTDQQGFRWQEYETWRRTADVIRAQFNPQFTINTGDMTQNGNRVSEWIDYYNGAGSLALGLPFEKKLVNGTTVYSNESAGVEQMNVVGNNDLSPLKDYMLGDGKDAKTASMTLGKISPLQFNYFYCYELDPSNLPANFIKNGSGTITGIESILPSCYSFNYNNCHFTAICSEITISAGVNIYHAAENDFTKTYGVIKDWLQKDLNKWYKHSLVPESTATYPWCICYMHEMPYTILTDEFASKDDATTKERTGGSKLNCNEWAGHKYMFSELFQNNHVRLVIGGHKHTHSQTWPLLENVTYTVDGDAKFSWELTAAQLESAAETRTVDSRHPIFVMNDRVPDSIYNAVAYAMKEATADQAVAAGIGIPTRYRYNGVAKTIGNGIAVAPVYVMSQASGNKVISNKEKPTKCVPWLQYYYPAKDNSNSGSDSAVHDLQKLPHFVVYEFNPSTSDATKPGNIKVFHYQVNKSNFANTPSSAAFFPQTEFSDPMAIAAGEMQDNIFGKLSSANATTQLTDSINIKEALGTTIEYTENMAMELSDVEPRN